MKRFFAFILAAVLVFSFVGCGKTQNEPIDPPADEVVETTPTPAPEVELPEVTVDNPATYVEASISDENGNYRYLIAYDNGEGGVNVEYVGDVKKVGTFEASALHGITAELENAGFAALNGQEVYEDGMSSASMYVSYADETYLSAGFSGTIPQEFMDSYAALDAYFQKLTAALPVYVPQPLVDGEVDEAVLAEILQFVEASGIENADAYLISNVLMDEYFGVSMGLEKTDGIASGTLFSAMMMTNPFSVAVAKLDASADADAVAKDFINNVDFFKWVCVLADNALVASKGDMVLCLVADAQGYEVFADAITQSGWTVIDTLQRD